GDPLMRVKMLTDVDRIHASTDQAGQKLRDLIEPALARGEEVLIDFEGVKHFTPGFFYTAIGVLIERDFEERILPLLRFENLAPLGQSSLDDAIEYAIRRRENPRWAAGMDAAILKRSQEAWE